MNETLITDLVSQQALDQLEELDRKMEGTLTQFQDCARELARGLKIPVEVTGDLERLRELANTTMQRAGQAAQQYTQQLQQQQQVIANTTNTISRQLMEQEKLNKSQRAAFTQNQEALRIAEQIVGTYEENNRQLMKYTAELQRNKAELKKVEEMRKNGMMTVAEAIRRSGSLMAEQNKLKAAMQEVASVVRVQAKEMNAAEGSYVQLSQRLELLKKAQKGLNEGEKAGEEGRLLEAEIQNLDARLKDLSADMGEFQRNVGNYAIAGKGLRTELRELTMQMGKMLADGVDPTSEAFITVAERAGALKDAMNDASATIKDYANDTKGLTNTLSVVETAARGWQTFQGALSAFGFETEEATKATQKLMGIMSMLQGVQKISTEITTNGTGAYRAYHAILRLLGIEKVAVTTATAAETAATEANTIAATEAATAETAVATSTGAATAAAGAHTAATTTETAAMGAATTAAVALRVALAALGVGAVIALIVALYEGIKEFNKEAEEAAEITKGLNDAIKEGEKATAASAAELRYYKGVVDDFNGSLSEEKTLVEELNSKYGESLGYYENIAQWKSALASISEYYIDVLKWEAIAQANLSKYAEATAEGNIEQARAYEENFEYYKKMAAAQSRVVQNLVKLRGGSTVKPGSSHSTSKSNGGSTKTDNGAEEAETMMRNLIDEANEMLGEWQKTATQRVIAIEALVTSTSVDAYKEQLDNVKVHYGVLESLIEENRDKAVAEKQKEFDEAIAKAKKYGKDTTELEQARITAMTAIDNDYQRQIERNREEMKATQADMTADLLTLISREAERNVSDITTVNAAKTNFIRELYLEELRNAEHNEEKIAEIKRRYADESAAHAKQTAIDVAQATIDGLEKALAVEEITDEQREQLAERLQKAKVAYAKAVADAEEQELNRTIHNEKEAHDKRMKNTEDWMQRLSDAIGKVFDLMSNLYDGQIAKIEELLEAEQLRYEQEVEHIDYLAERGAITTEEAEIRKREASAATAAKQEQLEKRKAQLEYKKAVMEKANSIAQIGIATALGIMKASPNIPLMAFVGAMGAIQVATALAQPIKAYAEGTQGKPHPGGLALVGDGDKAELVLYNGKAWVTPDSPTLVDLPKGAEVLPDAERVALMGAVSNIPRDRVTGAPIIINDYSALESRVASNTKAVTRELRDFRTDMARQLKRQKFNAYIARRI